MADYPKDVPRSIVNVPVERERLPKRKIKVFRNFLHIAGRPAEHDRNGTELVIEAFKKTPYSDMTLTINDTTLKLNTILDLSTDSSGSVFDIGIEEIKEFEINVQLMYVNATFDVIIEYNLPFQLNLSRITMNITTTLDTYLGNVTWISESSVILYPFEEVLIKDINILITNLNTQDLLILATDSAVKIPIGIIYLEFFSATIPVEFTIDRIEL